MGVLFQLVGASGGHFQKLDNRPFMVSSTTVKASVGASFCLLMCYSECMLRLKGLSLWLRGKEPDSNAGDAV